MDSLSNDAEGAGGVVQQLGALAALAEAEGLMGWRLILILVDTGDNYPKLTVL